MSRIRQIRRSQAIAPFGVGAIFDIGDESLVACDITQWKKERCDRITLQRLQNKLNVAEFRMPPVPSGTFVSHPPTLPYYRFPQWLFCQSCREMTHWSLGKEREGDGDLPKCTNSECRGAKTLVPMRFVLACEKGHLDDVPWGYWAHSRRDIASKGRCERHWLFFNTRSGAGGGLISVEIRCRTCKAARTLDRIASKDSMKLIGFRCPGRQPWERGDEGRTCKCVPQVLQRGASNVYYPRTVSGLDIPIGVTDPDDRSLEDEVRSHGAFEILVKAIESVEGDSGDDPAVRAIAGIVAEDVRCDVGTVLRVAGAGLDIPTQQHPDRSFAQTERELLLEEWPALLNPPYDSDPRSPYLAVSVDFGKVPDDTGLSALIERVVLVRRLREVRVLTGFTRIRPGNDDEVVKADLDRGHNWLPGIEVFGEGIFIAFSENAVAEWLARKDTELEQRIGPMRERREAGDLKFLPTPTARTVMLHTFAHIFIRQLAFECGYSASSLRERLYAADAADENGPMAGVLIYTADADSEGSLGGLVRQGRTDRLIPTILTALRRGEWCSADPICREMQGQGLEGLNLAACHACSLISETSCVLSNTLLDRMLVLGDDERHAELGFFSHVLQAKEDGALL